MCNHAKHNANSAARAWVVRARERSSLRAFNKSVPAQIGLGWKDDTKKYPFFLCPRPGIGKHAPSQYGTMDVRYWMRRERIRLVTEYLGKGKVYALKLAERHGTKARSKRMQHGCTVSWGYFSEGRYCSVFSLYGRSWTALAAVEMRKAIGIEKRSCAFAFAET